MVDMKTKAQQITGAPSTKAQHAALWFAAIADGRATVFVSGGRTTHCREHATREEADAAVARGARRIVKRVSEITVSGEPLANVARFLAP